MATGSNWGCGEKGGQADLGGDLWWPIMVTGSNWGLWEGYGLILEI